MAHPEEKLMTYEQYANLSAKEMLAYLTLEAQEATEWDQAQGCWVRPAEGGAS